MNPEDLQKQAELRQQIQQLEMLVKQRMTKEALERFGNIKSAHPEKAIQLLAVLGQAIQSGQIDEQIDDEQLKDILIRLTPEKKEFKIRRM
jgi:programmed cell death protein 5